MKHFIISCIVIALTITSISCLSCQKRQHNEENVSKEYVVQFNRDIEKKTIETIFDKYPVTSFSYLTSSRERGYILLIRLKSSIESTLDQLRQEKSVKHIDPNHERKIEDSK